MIWATEYKHVDLVKLLLSKGSDINIRDNVSRPGGGWVQGGCRRFGRGGHALAPARPVASVHGPSVASCVSPELGVT